MILDDVQIMNARNTVEWRFWKLYLSARGHNWGWEKHH